MAGADYISCKKCHTKIIYDGWCSGRERLFNIFGKASGLLCPDCVKELELIANKFEELELKLEQHEYHYHGVISDRDHANAKGE